MNSFQKRHRAYKTLELKTCTHGKNSIIYLKNASCQKPKSTKLPKQQNNCTARLSSRCLQQVYDDLHSTVIKSIIAMNQPYFQSKLQVPNDGKPKQLKLKIPSKTGFTVYKRDYIKNQQNNGTKMPKFKQNKIDGIFLGNTTYRNEFIGKQNEARRQRIQRQQSVDQTGPRFLQTQYKHNFQNWGAQNKMPSMKPQNIAPQSLPFQAVTMYSSDFTKKAHRKQEDHRLAPSIASTNSSNIISNQVSSPLLYMTTSNLFYDKKNFCKENIIKPKNQNLILGSFKGRTQYQSQFQKANKCPGHLSPSKKKTLGELQNLILKL